MWSRNPDRKVQSPCMIPLTDKGLGLNVCVVPPITYVPLISDGEICYISFSLSSFYQLSQYC